MNAVETPFGTVADGTPPFEASPPDPMLALVGTFLVHADVGFGRYNVGDYATREEAERAIEPLLADTAGCSRHHIEIAKWIKRPTDGKVCLSPVASYHFGEKVTEGWDRVV